MAGEAPPIAPWLAAGIRPCPGGLKIMRRCGIQKITLAVCAIDDRRSVLCILASAAGPNGSSPCLFIVPPLWRRQCCAPRAPATCDYPKWRSTRTTVRICAIRACAALSTVSRWPHPASGSARSSAGPSIRVGICKRLWICLLGGPGLQRASFDKRPQNLRHSVMLER